MTDLAILGQDPGFAGGVRAQIEALWRAAVAVGRDPELHYLRYRRLDGARAGTLLRGRSVSPTVPGFDIANVLSSSVRIALRTRDARTRFVCAAVASQGFAGVLARKPYGCWVSTSLADEWTSRRRNLGAARRVAHAVSASGLLLLERETLRNAAVRWTISESSRRTLARAAGLSESAISVVPIPIDTEQFVPAPDDEWERGLEAPELVFVGRADDPRKNIGLLLEGFARVRTRLPAARLTLVGTPPADALPAGVEAVGAVPSVAEPLRRASLFVLPSLQEGFGIVVAEALAAGVPVLVTPCGGPEELVRSSQGGEVLAGFDPDELADRALALLTDARLLGEMRSRGREYVVREHDPARLRTALDEALQVLDDAELDDER
jgi:glycosyltransferase involved in cell wall biosynthesis